MIDLQQKIILEGRTEEYAKQEQTLLTQVDERGKQEEFLWRQKSRIRWLKEGERNTKFFHSTTIQRRMNNTISHMQNSQGDKLEKQEDIEKELINHFKTVHQEQPTDKQSAINDILYHIPKLITEEHNKLLLRPVTIMEVEEASNQLKAGKAPGPDGFTSNLYHHFWDLIKADVWNVVEESRAMHWLLPSLNSTFTALIPKVARPSTPEKFRPIALCDVIYQIISKVIANRLKPLLPLLISPKQSEYVEGHQILDGIILTHETIHSLKTNKQAGMLLKIDLSKAFDKLSWSYINQMLTTFGISPT